MAQQYQLMASPPIFDNAHRSDASPMAGTEDTYSFLNRAHGVFWTDVRTLMKEWFTRYPGDKALALASSLRSGSSGFWDAYLELFLHEVLTRVGASLEVEPEVAGGTPDFRVRRGRDQFLLEATTLMEPGEEDKAELRTASVLDSLRKVESADFGISVSRVTQGPDQPSGARLAAQLDAWLTLLDYPELRSIAIRSWSDLPTTTLRDRGWELVVRPYPRAEGKRIPGPISIQPPGRGRFVDDHAAIQRDLQEKARLYRSADEPLVLAVFNRRWTADPEEVPMALYGAACDHPRMMKALRIDPTMRRLPEGLWLTRTGHHYTEVSAVLEVANVSPWHFADSRVIVWHNPLTPDAVESLPFHHVRVDLSTGTFDSAVPNRPLREILDIPLNWPRGGPFTRNT